MCFIKNILFTQTKQLRATAVIRHVLFFKKEKEQSRSKKKDTITFSSKCQFDIHLKTFAKSLKSSKNEDLRRSHPSEHNLSQLLKVIRS